jgi:hypothetical protein
VINTRSKADIEDIVFLQQQTFNGHGLIDGSESILGREKEPKVNVWIVYCLFEIGSKCFYRFALDAVDEICRLLSFDSEVHADELIMSPRTDLSLSALMNDDISTDDEDYQPKRQRTDTVMTLNNNTLNNTVDWKSLVNSSRKSEPGEINIVAIDLERVFSSMPKRIPRLYPSCSLAGTSITLINQSMQNILIT